MKEQDKAFQVGSARETMFLFFFSVITLGQCWFQGFIFFE